MSRREPLIDVAQIGPDSDPGYDVGQFDPTEGDFVHAMHLRNREEAVDLLRALAETLGYTFQRIG